MEFVFASKNIELTDAIKDYVRKKLSKLEKVYDILQAEVMISVEKYRHIADVKLILPRDTIKSTESSHDLYTSIDLLYESLEKQLKKIKEKKSDKRRISKAIVGDSESETEINIVREDFDPKPIAIEDAIKIIVEEKKNVIVFNDAETERISVIYKNDDGSYTLVET